MKDLTVEIPKKYKKALIERFSLKNARKVAGKMWEIRKRCPLCLDFSDCYSCPFGRFRNLLQTKPNFHIIAGCISWMTQLINLDLYHQPIIHINACCIWWHNAKDLYARKQLKLLKKKARKLIKWV